MTIGQIILKWFFEVIDFLQKTNEQIRLYYYDTSGRLVFVRFLEETEDNKKTFDFTTMISQVDLFSSVFWRQLKTTKIHFEIN